MKYDHILTKDILKKEYIENRLSYDQIGKKYGVPRVTVDNYLKRYRLRRATKQKLNFKDLTGKKFGRWKVLRQSNNHRFHKVYWVCKCKCGTIKEVQGQTLRQKHSKSCGCWNKEKNWQGYQEISGAYWRSIKCGAKERGIEFNLTIEYVWDLFLKQERKCALTGELLCFTRQPFNKKKVEKQTASLDRIDSNKGYLEGNVQWVLSDINKMKWQFDQDYFLSLCQKVSKYAVR